MPVRRIVVLMVALIIGLSGCSSGQPATQNQVHQDKLVPKPAEQQLNTSKGGSKPASSSEKSGPGKSTPTSINSRSADPVIVESSNVQNDEGAAVLDEIERELSGLTDVLEGMDQEDAYPWQETGVDKP